MEILFLIIFITSPIIKKLVHITPFISSKFVLINDAIISATIDRQSSIVGI